MQSAGILAKALKEKKHKMSWCHNKRDMTNYSSDGANRVKGPLACNASFSPAMVINFVSVLKEGHRLSCLTMVPPRS
jgi:hypothetical protein